MALSKSEIVVADPENWLINDGKLYVFGKPAPAGPVLFQRGIRRHGRGGVRGFDGDKRVKGRKRHIFTEVFRAPLLGTPTDECTSGFSERMSD